MNLQDQQARDKIAEALDQNLMVLAGAGAGKTYALVQRMANAVQTGIVAVDQLSAITFTRKAAGEMRGRFFSELKSRAKNADGEEPASHSKRTRKSRSMLYRHHTLILRPVIARTPR